VRPLGRVAPTPAERLAARPGDDLLDAGVVMDRGFDLPAPPAAVWPWLLQLGKRRAGWYLPRPVERFVPRRRRALRRVDPSLARLEPGQDVPDWGGPRATLTVVLLEPEATLLYRSARGAVTMTWCLSLTATEGGSRVHSRVRLAGVRRRRLAEVGGGVLDGLTIAGLAAGLDERLHVTRPR